MAGGKICGTRGPSRPPPRLQRVLNGAPVAGGGSSEVEWGAESSSASATSAPWSSSFAETRLREADLSLAEIDRLLEGLVRESQTCLGSSKDEGSAAPSPSHTSPHDEHDDPLVVVRSSERTLPSCVGTTGIFPSPSERGGGPRSELPVAGDESHGAPLATGGGGRSAEVRSSAGGSAELSSSSSHPSQLQFPLFERTIPSCVGGAGAGALAESLYRRLCRINAEFGEGSADEVDAFADLLISSGGPRDPRRERSSSAIVSGKGGPPLLLTMAELRALRLQHEVTFHQDLRRGSLVLAPAPSQAGPWHLDGLDHLRGRAKARELYTISCAATSQGCTELITRFPRMNLDVWKRVFRESVLGVGSGNEEVVRLEIAKQRAKMVWHRVGGEMEGRLRGDSCSAPISTPDERDFAAEEFFATASAMTDQFFEHTALPAFYRNIVSERFLQKNFEHLPRSFGKPGVLAAIAKNFFHRSPVDYGEGPRVAAAYAGRDFRAAGLD